MRARVGVSLLFAAAACNGKEWGGGNPVPAHPDSQRELPALPQTEVGGPAGGAPAAAGAEGTGAAAPGAATYRVEPGTQYPSLGAVRTFLKPGDVVEIVGGYTYPGGVKLERAGTAESKIVIRGVRRDGKRPILQGGQNTIEAAADHYVFEDLELTGGARRCFFHHAHDITIRRGFIHDCPQHGVEGADNGAGSLTIEETEVTRAGGGIYHHPIYVATDETAHPGSVFRLVSSYVHDGTGGNNVKTRAERNEILYNWIEAAVYHELEMIGPDGQDPDKKREDSQIVGNVIFQKGAPHAIRIGGDGTGDTGGRYRFVHNTIVTASTEGAIRLFDRVESVELFNNAFYPVSGAGGVVLFREDEVKWVTGKPVVTGRNNWFPAGSKTHPGLQGTKLGGAAVFAGFLTKDLRPGAGGPLAGAASPDTRSEGAFAFPLPLAAPERQPPRGKPEPGAARPTTQRPSIGAFEP